jgi:mannosyltransferase
MNRAHKLLLSIFVISFLLRVYDLGRESFWLDEYNNVTLSQKYSAQIISLVGLHVGPPLNYANPLLYPLLLHLWFLLVGVSEFSARFPSVVFGSASVVVFYRVGKLLYGESVGLLSALMLGFSEFHLAYSREARSYSLFILFCLISFYYLLRLIREQNFKYSLGYTLSTTLLLYTHFTGFFALITQNYAFLISLLLHPGCQNRLKRWLIIQMSIFILMLPLLPVILSISPVMEVSWLGKPGLTDIQSAFAEYMGSVPSDCGLLCLLPWILLALLPFTAFFKRTNLGFTGNFEGLYVVTLWFFLPVVLPFIFSYMFFPVFHSRYTMAASLPIYLLIAKGLGDISRRLLRLSLILAATILLLSNVNTYYSVEKNEQMREALSYVESNAGSGDMVVFYPDPYNIFSSGPYSNRTDLLTVGIGDAGQYRAEDHLRIWMVSRSKPDNATKNSINLRYRNVGKKVFLKVTVYEYKLRTPDQSALR